MPDLLSGYQFVELNQLALRRERIKVKAAELGLRGTVLLADEGINFSLGGEASALDVWLAWLAQAHGVDQPVLNRDPVESVPFLRLRMRIRPEIITFDPALIPGKAPTGRALSPQEWHALLQQDSVQLVDTRNRYEFELGTFRDAVDPAIDSFTEFRDWSLANLDREQPVAMFCTGGVRCEKASAWLLANGYREVYQLEGGILNYLRDIPADESLWQGECYVFDDRVALDHELKPTGRTACLACSRPVEGLHAQGMPPIVNGSDCGLCGMTFETGRLSGLREKARQLALAEAQGRQHIGPAAQADSAGQRRQGTQS